ncbi:unnamed protein product [Lampetra planeri]
MGTAPRETPTRNESARVTSLCGLGATQEATRRHPRRSRGQRREQTREGPSTWEMERRDEARETASDCDGSKGRVQIQRRIDPSDLQPGGFLRVAPHVYRVSPASPGTQRIRVALTARTTAPGGGSYASEAAAAAVTREERRTSSHGAFRRSRVTV